MNESQPARKRPALIGLPFDENSSYMRGAGEAPPLVRRAFRSASSNLWTETGIDLGREPGIFDSGDLDRSLPQSNERIEAAIAALLERNLQPVSLGGDHSVTWPVLRAFARKYENLSILHLDAHPDLYRDFEGNRFSNASPFARIMEEKLARRLVQAGIRTLNGHQKEQAARFGVEIVEMKDWRDDKVFEFDTPVYVSIDLDALDPAFAPGVSHWEPGGFSTRQLIRIIQTLRGEVVGADIVELNPARDPLGITAMAAAKILKELAGKIIGQDVGNHKDAGP